MNVYLFYFKRNPEYYDEVSPLYCYTDDKEMMEEFKKQRNMKRFICKKESISKSEYKEFMSKHPKLRLTYGRFYTASEIYGKREHVSVLCTWAEEESILKNSERIWNENSRYLFDGTIFKGKYLKSLEKLLFIKFYNFYKVKVIQSYDNFCNPYYSSYGPVEDFIIDEMNSSFSYDELKLFLKFYGNTFDEKAH